MADPTLPLPGLSPIEELFRLVGEMTLIAHELKEEYGYDFPLRSGRFVEDGQGKFTLKEDPAPGGPAGAAEE